MPLHAESSDRALDQSNLRRGAISKQMQHATMAKLTRAPQLKQWQQSYFRSDERISDLTHHRQAEK
jgi:hypothetical protein